MAAVDLLTDKQLDDLCVYIGVAVGTFDGIANSAKKQSRDHPEANQAASQYREQAERGRELLKMIGGNDDPRA